MSTDALVYRHLHQFSLWALLKAARAWQCFFGGAGLANVASSYPSTAPAESRVCQDSE
jgi:hypothetical protein